MDSILLPFDGQPHRTLLALETLYAKRGAASLLRNCASPDLDSHLHPELPRLEALHPVHVNCEPDKLFWRGSLVPAASCT